MFGLYGDLAVIILSLKFVKECCIFLFKKCEFGGMYGKMTVKLGFQQQFA